MIHDMPAEVARAAIWRPLEPVPVTFAHDPRWRIPDPFGQTREVNDACAQSDSM